MNDKEDMVHIHSGIALRCKKNKITPLAATRMDLEMIIISELSQKDRDKYHMTLLICGI